jgi:hypothetical protein
MIDIMITVMLMMMMGSLCDASHVRPLLPFQFDELSAPVIYR